MRIGPDKEHPPLTKEQIEASQALIDAASAELAEQIRRSDRGDWTTQTDQPEMKYNLPGRPTGKEEEGS